MTPPNKNRNRNKNKINITQEEKSVLESLYARLTEDLYKKNIDVDKIIRPPNTNPIIPVPDDITIETPDQEQEEQDELLQQCNPASNAETGVNQQCVEIADEDPNSDIYRIYCNEYGACVECLSNENCPSEVSRACVDVSCVDPDDQNVLPSVQCDDQLAINYQTDLQQFQCPSGVSQCINFFEQEYGMSWPHTESDLLNDGCCCYNLLGVDVELPPPGDLNGDGEFNVLDVVILVGTIIGSTPIPETDYFYLPPYNPGTGEACPPGSACFAVDPDGTPTGYFTDGECYQMYNCLTLDCPIDETECPCYGLGCCDENCTEFCPELPILGCTDDGTNNPYGDYEACNYNSDADTDDGSCIYTTDTPGLGAEMGEGPFACDGFEGAGSTCLGFLDPDVLHVYPQGNPNQGQQCDGSCGKADDPIPNKIKILDCNGTCISLNIWLNYVQTDPYDEPGVCMDYQPPNANFACTSATQVDGEEFYFNCSLGNCEDNCGVCLGTNDCGDCNGVPNGASQPDGYPLSETTELSISTVNTGCCPADTRIKYYLDLDGDGLGEDTPTNESPTFQGYALCADNPNLSDHCYSPTNDVGCGAFDNLTDCENAGCTFGTPFVSNQLDNCPNGGYIDICGNCTTDADYPGTAVCGGCTDDATPACNYDEEAIWDDGSCHYTYQNNSLYCNCNSDSTPENLYGSSFYNCDGVCTTITDCAGECGGGAVEDCLGVCGGNATTCTDTDACNTGICATCEYPTGYPDNVVDCYGICLNDSDGDGVCDEDEVDGCTDIDACNYNSSATDDDGSCTYPEQYKDCDGNCLNDDDGDLICDEVEGGYIYTDACNFDNQAMFDDGTCTFPEYPFDCNGDCTLETDCAGVCGGTSVVDQCGVCGGNNYFDENGVLPNGHCDCFGNVDLGCGCGNPEANACGDCGNVIVDEGCGCGNGPPTGCDDQCGSTAVEDECGVCDGDGPPTNYDCLGNCIAEVDCAGVCAGVSEIDDCGQCTGDAGYQAESCYGCTYESADNFDPLATIDNGDCVFGLRAESDNVELLGDLLIPSAVGEKETYWHTFYYPYSQSIPAFDLYNNI